MPRRKTVTNAVKSAARRNIRKAQVTRIRIREPRSLGRMARHKASGSTFRRK